MYSGPHHQPARIHQKVAFAAVYLLCSVVAADPLFFCGPHRLAVYYDGRAGGFSTTSLKTGSLSQGSVDLLPATVEAPETKVVVSALPGWEAVGKQAPSASSPHHLEEDRVEQLAGLVGSCGLPPGAASGTSGWSISHSSSERSVGQERRLFTASSFAGSKESHHTATDPSHSGLLGY